MSKDGKPKEEGVGYGRPPKHSQFQKGKSGNASGRPKGAVSLKTDLESELGEMVEVTENGRPLKLTKQRLLVKKTIHKAHSGDVRSSALIFSLIERMLGLDGPAAANAPLSAEDQEVLEALKAGIKAQLKGNSDV